MKTVAALFLALLAAAHAGPRTGGTYAILTDIADRGGQHTTSATYTNDGSAGTVAGLSTAASSGAVARNGYAGQLYDITGLVLNSATANSSVSASGTVQLAAWQVLDDTSYLTVNPASVAWGVVSGPITGISGTGLATAGLVSQDTLATVQGSYGPAAASLTLTVVPLSSPPAWRELRYGRPDNSGNAADTADPYGTGVTNLQVFAFLGPDQNPALAQQSQLPAARMIGGNYVFSFFQPAGVTGVVYGAEYTTSLTPVNWQPVADTGSGTLHTFSVPIGANSQIFLRLLVTEQ